MEQTSLIRTILKEQFPEDCEIVGQRDLDAKLAAKDPLAQGLGIPSEHNIDVSASLDIVGHAIVVLRDMVMLYAAWRAAQAISKTPMDLKKHAQETFKDLPDEVTTKLLDLA